MARLDRIWLRMLSEDGNSLAKGDSMAIKNGIANGDIDTGSSSGSSSPKHEASETEMSPAMTAIRRDTSASRVAAMRSVSPERLTRLAHTCAKVN